MPRFLATGPSFATSDNFRYGAVSIRCRAHPERFFRYGARHELNEAFCSGPGHGRHSYTRVHLPRDHPRPLDRPFRAWPLCTTNPGRCPGLACFAPSGQGTDSRATTFRSEGFSWAKQSLAGVRSATVPGGRSPSHVQCPGLSRRRRSVRAANFSGGSQTKVLIFDVGVLKRLAFLNSTKIGWR